MSNFDFYGNAKAIQTLTCSVMGERLSHAYLFYGESGIGKRTLATQFARAILCPSSGKACGLCPSCIKAIKNGHPDLLVFGAEGGKNSFHADVVRKIRNDAYIRPNDGAYKVYILNYVDNMSMAAANALLKILEEPPQHVVFILTCTSKNMIPETLVSRCIPIGLYPVSPKECTEAVSRLTGEQDQAQIDYAVSLSGGIIGKALSLLSDKDRQQSAQIAQQMVLGLTSKAELDIVLAISPLDGNRALTLATFSALIDCIRQAILCKVHATYQDNPTSKLAEVSSLKSLLRMTKKINQAKANLDRNANLGLTITWLCANLK